MSNNVDRMAQSNEEAERREKLQDIIDYVEDAFAEYETFDRSLYRILETAQELLEK
jgi:hypothetical protein